MNYRTLPPDTRLESLPLSVDPATAQEMIEEQGAVLFDIRTLEERQSGFPEGSLHVAWQVGLALLKNPRFTREVLNKVHRGGAALLICRSGRRSLDAARALRNAGHALAFDVAEGCSGTDGAPPPSGWKARGLPWRAGK